MAPSHLRLFVACELPEVLRSALAGLQADLRERAGAQLRWVRAEGIHLTLKFLGEVNESRLDQIESALCGSVEPFDVGVRPAKLGGFGGGRLRVIWVGLEGDLDELGQLARVVERALAPVGFEEESRPFRPHLTLARVPDRLGNDQRRELSELVAAFELPAMPSVRLSQLSLIRSVLGPGGARYQTISRYPAGPS